MKIITGDKDKRASAEIYYKPSQYFRVIAEENEFDKKGENETSEYEYISKIMAIFTDILEVVNMDYGPSVVCFGNALEGLISGTARQLAINYGVDYDNQTTIQELLETLKQKINGEKEFLDVCKKHNTEKDTQGIKDKKNKIIYLKKSFE